MDSSKLLREQVEYYRARVSEYDDWWFRRGRYDHGRATNARWWREVHELESALARFAPTGRVLELACGTGIWTQRLTRCSTDVTAVDSARGALYQAKRRAPLATVVHADIFEWNPGETSDVCFFSFWLSHVPSERFEAFWDKVRGLLAPGGRVFFVDSARSPLGTAKDQVLPHNGEEIMRRTLDDGREFQIVKRYYGTSELANQLGRLGWAVAMRRTTEFFIYGEGGLSEGMMRR